MKIFFVLAAVVLAGAIASLSVTGSRKVEKEKETKKSDTVRIPVPTIKHEPTAEELGLVEHAPGADYSPFEEVVFTATKWGHKLPGLIYVPDEGGAKGEKYPLIITFHGRSIAGKNLGKLFREGVARQVHEGKKIEAVNPVDGKLYKFIVFAPLTRSWSMGPEHVGFALDDLIKRYPIDPSRIYVTGYSAGGWSTAMVMTHKGVAERIAAAVCMSPSLIDGEHLKSFKVTADARLYSWVFAGTAEPHFLQNARMYKDSSNKYHPGLSRITITEHSHCCWQQYYSPDYRQNGKSIYEWMLQFHK